MLRRPWLRPTHALLLCGVLALLLGGILLRVDALAQLGYARGLSYPLGPDWTMWARAAENLKQAGPVSIPPLFPLLLAMLEQGYGYVYGAVRVNSLGIGLAVLSAAMGAAALCDRAVVAAGAAIAAAGITGLLLPTPAFYTVQPECITFGTVTLMTAAGALLGRYPRPVVAFVYGAAAGLAFSSREHGIVVALAAALVLPLIVQGQARQRVGLILAACAGAQLAAGAVVRNIRSPFWVPGGVWHGTIIKAMVPFQDSMNLANGQTTHSELAEELGDKPETLGFFGMMADRAWTTTEAIRPYLLVAALAAAFLVYKGRWRSVLGAAAGLSPLAAFFVVYTEPRHAFVLGPSAILLAVGGAAALAEAFLPRHLVAIGLVAAMAWMGVRGAPAVMGEHYKWLNQWSKVYEAKAERIEIAAWLRKNAEYGSILMGPEDVAVMTGMVRGQPQPQELRIRELPPWPHGFYRLYILSTKEMGEHWDLLQTFTSYKLYRLERPAGVPVDCLYGLAYNVLVRRGPGDAPPLPPHPHPDCEVQP